MLLRRQVSEERDEHIDMTPMVDVVFQLMTFMLFSIQMTGSEVNVPEAKHGVGVEETAATFLTLLPPEAPGGEPRLLLGIGDRGKPTTVEAAKQSILDGLREGRRKVILQADGEVPHGAVLKAAAAVSEVEGVSLNIGVQEPR